MTAKLIVLAAGMAIPFGSPDVGPARPHELVEMSASFEFAETDEGYDLNAILEDHGAEEVHRVFIDRCSVIDIDSFNEDLFGTPAICDDTRYVFDVVGGSLVAVSPDGEVELMELEVSHLVLNGVPMMVEAAPSAGASAAIADEGRAEEWRPQ